MDNVHELVGGLRKTPLQRALPLKRPKAADLGLDAFLTYCTHTHTHCTQTEQNIVNKTLINSTIT